MNTLAHSSASPVTQSSINVLHSFKDALTAGVLTLIVLGPITNLVLDQYDFNFMPWREPVFLNGIYMALLVFIVRFVVSLLAQSRQGAQFSLFSRATDNGVQVESRQAPPPKDMTVLGSCWRPAPCSCCWALAA